MTRALSLPLAALALASVPGAQERVRWQERFHPVDELPAEMPAAAREAVGAWAGWAGEHGYRLDLEDEGRLLLISPGDGKTWRATLRLAERTIAAFDAALPVPERMETPPVPASAPGAGSAPLPEDPGGGPLPEDPEGIPPGFGESPGASDPGETTWSTVWGAGTGEPDTQTIAFLVVRGEEDYGALTDHLGAAYPYLAGWAKAARRYTGFALEHPLAGAYVTGASGQEEWSPDNELVHRLAELLLVRRFGQAPYWLIQGVAWHLEEHLQGGIYCFPYRDEFVWATEHTAWPGEVKRDFEKRREPVTIDELYFPRGCFEGAHARRSFGAVRYLVEEHPGTLSAALEELRVFRDAHGRVDQGGGTWSRDRDYEVPLVDQARILRTHVGADVFAEMTAALGR
jgi:hypothetical protein